MKNLVLILGGAIIALTAHTASRYAISKTYETAYDAGYEAGWKDVEISDFCEEVSPFMHYESFGNLEDNVSYDYVECRFNIEITPLEEITGVKLL